MNHFLCWRMHSTGHLVKMNRGMSNTHEMTVYKQTRWCINRQCWMRLTRIHLSVIDNSLRIFGHHIIFNVDISCVRCYWTYKHLVDPFWSVVLHKMDWLMKLNEFHVSTITMIVSHDALIRVALCVTGGSPRESTSGAGMVRQKTRITTMRMCWYVDSFEFITSKGSGYVRAAIGTDWLPHQSEFLITK